MRQPHQVAVIAGRIDHDEVVAVLERRNGLGESIEFRALVVVEPASLRARATQKCVRNLEIELARAATRRCRFST